MQYIMVIQKNGRENVCGGEEEQRDFLWMAIMIETIHYNTNVFNFRNLFENCLGELESIHKNFDIVEVEELTGGGVCDPVENTQYGLIEKLRVHATNK